MEYANNSAPGWSLEDYAAELESSESLGFFTYSATRVITGFVLYRVIDRGAWIMNLGVESKGLGQGTRLMEAFFKELASIAELHSVGLEVRSRNERAVALYRKLGFSEIGRRKAYYKDGDDALVFRRSLD